MLVNIQVSSSLIKSLEQSAMKLRSYGTEHVHAILFLENKLLSWHSTRRSYHLTAEDLLFLMTLCQKTWPLRSDNGMDRRKRGRNHGASGSGVSTTSEDEGRGRGSKKLDSSHTSTTSTTDESDDEDDDDSYSSSFGYFDSTESLVDVEDEEDGRGAAGTENNLS